ncbi:hypothetical protein [uncultured Microbulbifer sp.]|uniref:hypothetical protein n=1 Tax=uncultured Microbulbifer sp. TaxID=348147 RepID=UPI00260987E7|nr:hypothetical protein [uncultured Microbulbifer sp.]
MSDQLKVESNLGYIDEMLQNFTRQASNQIYGRAVARSATKLSRLMRKDAPRVSRNLVKDLGTRRLRGKRIRIVGVRWRYYYNTLEMKTNRPGTPFNPWFRDSFNRHAPGVLREMEQEMLDAINQVAEREDRKSRGVPVRRPKK